METLTFKEFVLSELRLAASQGRRCASNPELREMAINAGIQPTADGYPSSLAYAGQCRVEIYGKSWRVVEIDGMRTEEYKEGAKPYIVVADGRRLDFAKKRERREASPGGESSNRPCLRCSEIFPSAGKHERFCTKCKSDFAWRSGGDFEAPI